MDSELTLSILARLEALERAIYRRADERGPVGAARNRPGDRPQYDRRDRDCEGPWQNWGPRDQTTINEKRLVDLIVRLVAEHTDDIVMRRLEEHLAELVRRWPPPTEEPRAPRAPDVGPASG